jgi:hypothetical protein
MSLETALEFIEEYYEANLEVLVISTRGQVWRGGGATVMDTKEYKYWLYKNLFTRDNMTPNSRDYNIINDFFP